MFVQIAFVFILIFALGFLLCNAIKSDLSLDEKIGMAYPLGIVFLSLLMVLMNSAGQKFSFSFLVLGCVMVNSLLAVYLLRIRKLGISELLSISSFRFSISFPNLSFFLLLSTIIYILYGITTKSLYWPTFSYDGMTGYEQMAMVMAAEGFINNSIFDPISGYATLRHPYPPFATMTFAIPYFLGLGTSKVSMAIMFISMVVYFWAMIKKHTTHTLALLGTLVIVSTPEYVAMSAITMTNVIHSLFVSGALVATFVYCKSPTQSNLLWASLLMGLNLWTRTEGVVIVPCGCLMILIALYRMKKRSIKDYALSLGWYVSIPLAFFGVWQFFLKFFIKNDFGVSGGRDFPLTLAIDNDRIAQMYEHISNLMSNSVFYGITFLLFIITLVVNIRRYKSQNAIFTYGLLSSFIIYLILYYQMMPENEIRLMMTTSFRRGLFMLVPAVGFYIATNSFMKQLFRILYTPYNQIKAKDFRSLFISYSTK